MVLTARIIGPGRYVLRGRGHTLTRVQPGSLAISCELCEWCVFVPRDLDYAESLRRQHLGTAHLSALTSGAAVLDVDLV